MSEIKNVIDFVNRYCLYSDSEGSISEWSRRIFFHASRSFPEPGLKSQMHKGPMIPIRRAALESDRRLLKSIDVTLKMETAGIKVLEESGMLENGIYKARVNASLIRDIFKAMIEAMEVSDLKMRSGPATKL